MYLTGNKDSRAVFSTLNFVATAGQTVFNFGGRVVNPHAAVVYRNGVRLFQGDYTMSDTQVTLTNPCLVSDEIVIDTTIAEIAGTKTQIFTETFTGNGVLTEFTFTNRITSSAPAAYQVYISGVCQEPITDYTVDVTNQKIVFTSPVPNGLKVIVRVLAETFELADSASLQAGVNTALTTANAALPKSGGTMTGPIVLSGDPVSDLQAAPKQYVDAASPAQIQTISASVAANALTVQLSPTKLDFRSTTLSSGAVNRRTVASPISLTVSSGSTLGTVNATAARLVVLAIDNAGTVELAITNLSGGLNLDETSLISTTAEGGAGAADSANVIYSATARTNVPFRIVGFVDITQATAGTWVSAPTLVQGRGGQALAAMSSLGYGQTYQSQAKVTATTYYNTTGKPIHVCITKSTSSTAIINVGGVNISSDTAANLVSFIVPAGASYSCTCPNIATWYELR